MRELIAGILSFRKNSLPRYRETFSRLEGGQQPRTLWIACSDSRVVPNLLTATGPGDLFVVRNAGNLVPPCGEGGLATDGDPVWGAIEFALAHLPVRNIVVCGHSGCGAMRAALSTVDFEETPHLGAWIRHCHPSMARLERGELHQAALEGL